MHTTPPRAAARRRQTKKRRNKQKQNEQQRHRDAHLLRIESSELSRSEVESRFFGSLGGAAGGASKTGGAGLVGVALALGGP